MTGQRCTGVVRFFFGHDTKTGKNELNEQKINQMFIKYPKGHKTFQTDVKYINIFQSKALQNLPKIGIFGLKSNHLATSIRTFDAIFLSLSNYFFPRSLAECTTPKSSLSFRIFFLPAKMSKPTRQLHFNYSLLREKKSAIKLLYEKEKKFSADCKESIFHHTDRWQAKSENCF
jgi:hypothetical protein